MKEPSRKRFTCMVLFVQLIYMIAHVVSDDLLEAIIDTQHSFCYSSIPCAERNKVSGDNSIDIIDVDSDSSYHSEFNKSYKSYENYFWKDQVKLRKATCCADCSCQEDICLYKGTCCPDVHQTSLSFLESDEKQKTQCMAMQMKPRSTYFDDKIYPNSFDSVNVVTKCNDIISPIYRRDIARKMCESDTNLDIFSTIPVTHKQTFQTFKNKYCAECNGVNEELMYFWDAEIACNVSTFKPTTIDNIVSDVQEREDCNILFTSDVVMDRVDKCLVYISECNVTGKWQKRDHLIEMACSSYTSVYLSNFRNMFCYMCNTDVAYGPVACNFISISKTDKGFSLLLNHNSLYRKQLPIDKGENTKCAGFTVYDPLQDKCIGVKCMEPKLYQNGSCVNIGDRIGGVGYRVFLVFKPLSSGVELDHRPIKDFITKLLIDTGLEVFTYTLSILVKRSFWGDVTIDYYVTYFEFYFPAVYPQDITMVDIILQKHGTILEMNSYHRNTSQQLFLLELDLFDVHEAFTPEQYLTDWDLNGERTVRIEPLDYVFNKNVSEFEGIYVKLVLPLLPLNTCPLVSLNSTFYGVVHHPWGIRIDRYGVKLKRSEYMLDESEYDHSSIQVCQQTLEQLTVSELGKANVGARELVVHWLYLIVLYVFVSGFVPEYI